MDIMEKIRSWMHDEELTYGEEVRTCRRHYL